MPLFNGRSCKIKCIKYARPVLSCCVLKNKTDAFFPTTDISNLTHVPVLIFLSTSACEYYRLHMPARATY